MQQLHDSSPLSFVDKTFVLYVVVGSVLLTVACKILLSKREDEDFESGGWLSNGTIAKVALMSGLSMLAAKISVDMYERHTKNIAAGPTLMEKGVETVQARPSIQRIVR